MTNLRGLDPARCRWTRSAVPVTLPTVVLSLLRAFLLRGHAITRQRNRGIRGLIAYTQPS